MELELNEDQRMLEAMVGRLVDEHHGFHADLRKSPSASGSRQAWARFAELGLLALPFAEADGGLGGGGAEMMIVGEAFGRGLVGEPYLSAVVLAGAALSGAGRGAARDGALSALVCGEALFAFVEGDLTWADFGLSGTARGVLGGAAADRLVVAAGDRLLLLDASQTQRRGFALHGGGQAADVTFSSAQPLAILDDPGGGAVRRVREAAIAFLAAEAVGAMQAAFDLTLDYLKTRVQFDRPIGANQALQHRAAEMLVELEQARSAALYAALLADSNDAHERMTGMAAVKAVIGRTGRFIGQQAVQLHGGIGLTEDYAVGHYFKRLTAIDLLFGDADQHLARLAQAGGFIGPDAYWDEAAAPPRPTMEEGR